MVNTLNKVDNKVYIPGSPFVPERPGSPARPGGWYSVDEEVCEWVPNGGGGGGGGGSGGDGQNARNLQYAGGGGSGGSSRVCSTTRQNYYRAPYPGYPATPRQDYVAGQVIVNNNLGWNARARSVAAFDYSGTASFKVPESAIGAIVGLSDLHYPTGYADIKHGFYASHGKYRVMEEGVGKTSFASYTGDDVFEVRRVGERVEYFVDDSLIYSSDALTDNTLMLVAALYSAGDTVDSPEINGLSVGALSLPAVAMLGADRSISGGNLTLPAVVLSGREAMRVALALPAFMMTGADRPYSEGRVVLPSFTVEGSAGAITPAYAIGDLALPVIQLVGGGMSGEIGGGDATIPAFLALGADRPYADGRLTMPPISAWGHAYEGPNFASIYSGAGVDARFSGERTLTVVFSEGMKLASIFGASRLIEGDIRETVQALLSLVGQREITANAIVVIYPGQVVEQGGVGDTWVVNAESMGSTRYEGFDFNSYAKIGDSYFGCRADGIYQLDGDTDAGDPIRAMVSFGKQDFGTSMLKRITNAYIGVSSAGRMFLRVIAEGQEYTYAARSADESLQVQRIDTGKGLRVNYLEFELYNEDGNDFELASVEFAVLPMSRRI